MRLARRALCLLVVMLVVSGCTVRETIVGLNAAEDPLGKYCGTECRAALKVDDTTRDASCRVAFINSATSFPYGAAQATAAQATASSTFPNMRFSVLNGQGSVTTQSSQLDTVASSGVDVVILDAVVENGLVPAAERAKERGVKVIAVDRTIDTPVFTTIKAPDVKLAERVAAHAAKQLGGSGKVAILSGSPGASPTINRTAGITRTFEKYPGIEIVDNVNGDYDITKAYQVTRNLLTKYGEGELDWIISEADTMSLGAIQAIEAARREGTVKLSGMDGQQQGIERVADGTYEATAVYPIASSAGVVAAAKACTGADLPKRINLDYPLVTRANADRYLGTTYG